jgi:glycosyltransferase involved in cell wall biosynthesis
MIVLHVLNELQPSGAETMLLSAAGLWCERTEQHILTTGDREGALAPALREAGYIIHHLPFDRSLRFFREFARVVEHSGCDVLHLHTERASQWYAVAARLSCRRSLRIVRTVHHLFRFDGYLRFRRMVGRRFMKRVLRVRFLSNSPSGQRNERKRFRMHNELVPDWYDSKKFVPANDGERREARRRLGFDDETTVFVSLGGNWSYKNYDMIVEALAWIPAEHPLRYVQIGVQGQGDPLETLAKSLGVSDRLSCVGVVVDARPYLHAADAYLMPSSEEGFGVAAVEAMASGLPAILSDVEALCDFRENLDGIRYIDPTPGDIAEAMTDFCTMPVESLHQLGRNLAVDVEKHYGLQVGPLGYLKAWGIEENRAK